MFEANFTPALATMPSLRKPIGSLLRTQGGGCRFGPLKLLRGARWTDEKFAP